MANVGSAYVTLVPSMKDFSAKVNEEMPDSGTESGNTFGKYFNTAVLAAAATAAASVASSFVSSAIDAYAEYEQLVGGVETLFGDSAGALEEYAASAYKNQQISANDYMELATSFSATLLQGLDGDTEAAVEYANLAITDMSDNASKMGTDISAIQDAYNGFAKSNFTMLDNLKLGYGGTQSEMIRLINDSGILEEEISSLDDITFDQMIEAIHVVQTNLGITGTTAEEASQTVEGSVNSMQAAYEDWLVALGRGDETVTTATQNLVDSFFTAASNVVPVVGNVIESVVQAIIEQLPTITETIATVLSEGVPTILATGLDLLLSLVDAVSEAIPTIVAAIPPLVTGIVETLLEHVPDIIEGGVTLIASLVESVVEAIPVVVEALPQLIDALVSAILDSIPVIIETGIDLITALISDLPTIISTITAVAPTIISELLAALLALTPTLIDCGVELLVALVDNLPAIISTITGAMPEIVTAIVDTLLGNMNVIIEGGVELITAVISDMPTIISTVVGAIPELIDGIVGGVVDGIPDMVQAGADLFSGISEGIGNVIGSVVSVATGAASSIVQGVKGLLGIASPSKVFAEIGGYSMEGLAEGIEDGTDEAEDAMARSIDGLTAAADVSFSATGGGTSGGGIVINIESMAVREEADIERISAELAKLIKRRQGVAA